MMRGIGQGTGEGTGPASRGERGSSAGESVQTALGIEEV